MYFNHQASLQRIWYGDTWNLAAGDDAIRTALRKVAKPVFIVESDGQHCATHSGSALFGTPDAGIGLESGSKGRPLLGFVPGLHPQSLGDSDFKRDLGLRYAYIVGAMANGITSTQMLREAGLAGMIGFFGAGGLTLTQLEAAIDRVEADRRLTSFPFGFNLIHSPSDPQLEAAVVDLYLRRGIRLVSASAYLGVTLPLVYYRVKGIRQTPQGDIDCPNRVIAKVSRVEVGSRFFSPPPEKMLTELVRQGKITSLEAQLAAHIPLAQDMTAEADSGGHTDNRPAMALLPTFMDLRDELAARYGYRMPLRVGLAGGIATPLAAAAAFSMGAAWVLTGSINQACIEADTSTAVRELLAQAQQADVTMAPAADMFELGVRVQVLKRGTMFAMRGAKLYDYYRAYESYDQIPAKERETIERTMLQSSFETCWQQTCRFFAERDPSQITRAEKDPKHKMALVFRSYLGLSSVWAKSGDPQRRMDYQIWCGPAMGAFNAWAKGSFMEKADQRRTAEIGLNLLYGAAGLTRLHWLRSQGLDLPPVPFPPLPLKEIETHLQE